MRREAVREYTDSALWVMPFLAGNVALLVGLAVSQVQPEAGTLLARLEFQGTSAQARDLLVTITGTVVTVIALVLGLSVVALQLTSTQFSPRLLRNFLRDRSSQVVLSIFMATFAYCAAGLYQVGIGANPEVYPRVAVSGAIALLFVSLGGVVYFADHLSHSIQVDAIMQRVEREALDVVRHLPVDVEMVPPAAPSTAVDVAARTSGYIVTAHPEILVPLAVRYGVSIALSRRVGEHVVAGATLARIWSPRGEGGAMPDPRVFETALDSAVGVSFERTRQQDAAIGIRQLVDVACKALSPAVNDPYTAVQAVDHLAVIFSELARHKLGPKVSRSGDVVVVVPYRRFGEYLGTMCGLIRRNGAREPTLMVALVRLLETAADVARTDWTRLHDIADQLRLLAADAEREIAQEADVAPVLAAADALHRRIEEYRATAW